MPTGVVQDRSWRLTIAVGLLVVGFAVVLAVFVATLPRDLGPGDDVPRFVAIGALYATIGILAIVGAIQRRPAIVVAAGALCVVGMFVSVAAIEFGIPGLALLYLGPRLATMPQRSRREGAVALAVAALVGSGAVALLMLTDARCWQASGSRTDPTYSVTDCGPQNSPPPAGPSGSWASGYDSGVLTYRGAIVEGALLLGALILTVGSGQGRSIPGRISNQSSGDVPHG